MPGKTWTRAVLDLEDAGGQRVDEVAVVRDEDDGAGEVAAWLRAGRLWRACRGGWWARRAAGSSTGCSEHAGQRVAVALAAGEHAERLEDVVAGEQKAAEQAAQLGLGNFAGRLRLMSSSMRGVGIELLVLVLREIVRRDVVAERERARGRRLPVRVSSLISVDLPAPLTPTSAMRSPRSMVKFTSSRTVFGAVALREIRELRATVRPLAGGCGKVK